MTGIGHAHSADVIDVDLHYFDTNLIGFLESAHSGIFSGVLAISLLALWVVAIPRILQTQ